MFFSKPYLANRQIIIVPDDSFITAISHLSNKKVGFQRGSTAKDALDNHPTLNTLAVPFTPVPFKDNIFAFRQLQAH